MYEECIWCFAYVVLSIYIAKCCQGNDEFASGTEGLYLEVTFLLFYSHNAISIVCYNVGYL